MPDDSLHVRISELKALRDTGTLTILGLGSCVGFSLYDPEKKAGGLAHVMLPSSLAFPIRGGPAKFADLALPALRDVLLKLGARPRGLVAKLTGGSTMFASASGANLLPLGLRNVMAVREAIRMSGIPLLVEDVGGTQGRSVYFHVEDGRMLVKRVHQPDAWF